jgi:aspartate 1-decarboxylase
VTRPYSNLENSDLLYFSSGDAVTIMDYNSETPNYDYRTITSIDLSSSEITLNSAPSNTYAAGDVIIFSDYDKLTPAQKAHNYATMADPTGFINGSQDVEGFSYRA